MFHFNKIEKHEWPNIYSPFADWLPVRDGSSPSIHRKWENLRIVPVCVSSSFQSTTCQSSKYHLEVFNASWILNIQLVRFVFPSGLLS